MTDVKKPDSDSKSVSSTSSSSPTFPKYVGFILGDEFCERYAFFGMRTILVLFLTYFIKFDEDTSTVIYHAFTVLCYLFPLMGGALADSFFGKYKIILWLSLVYAGGMAVFAMSALPEFSSEDDDFRTTNAILAITGLVIISIGTGGIKPCVSSFGGDQFENDEKNTKLFFDLFYWAINAGSFFSTLLSPLIREWDCGTVLGTGDNCYFVAFFIPAVLMLLAVGMFVLGTKHYRIVPPTGVNIFWECIKCMWYGATRKVPEESVEKNWLYGAYGLVDDWLIRDTTYLVKVLVMFLPMPLFWAAYDQQGSRWTLQAVRMNGYLTDTLHLLPDQALIINPILILMFIPVFNYGYKLLEKCITLTTLRKQNVGMVLAALAYLVSAAVQNSMDTMLTIAPSIGGEISLRVLNIGTEDFEGEFWSAEADVLPESLKGSIMVPSGGESLKSECYAENAKSEVESCMNEHFSSSEAIVETNTEPGAYGFNWGENSAEFEKISGRLVWNLAVFEGNQHLTYPGWTSKDSDGKNHVVMVSGMKQEVVVNFECAAEKNGTYNGCESSEKEYKFKPCEFDSEGVFVPNTESRNGTVDKTVKPFVCINGEEKDDRDAIKLKMGSYQVIIKDTSGEILMEIDEFDVGTGAGYTIILKDDLTHTVIQDINSNDISMLWILPQFILITFSELMVSIPSMEFTYTQAPNSLKAVMASFRLLTVSVGNFVVIIVAEGKIMPTQVGEYLLFAGLIAVASVALVLLSAFYYEYVPDGTFDSFTYPESFSGVKIEDEDVEGKVGEKNDAFDGK